MIGTIIAAQSNLSSYQLKDAAKFKHCNKLIARGTPGSSSNLYSIWCEARTNVGVYDPEDVVGISVNGARAGRLPFDGQEVARAAIVGVVFITDTVRHRSRSFNVGERELAQFLVGLGYRETAHGKWQRI